MDVLCVRVSGGGRHDVDISKVHRSINKMAASRRRYQKLQVIALSSTLVLEKPIFLWDQSEIHVPLDHETTQVFSTPRMARHVHPRITIFRYSRTTEIERCYPMAADHVTPLDIPSVLKIFLHRIAVDLVLR